MLQLRERNTNATSLFGWVSTSVQQLLKRFEPRESSRDLIYQCSPEDLEELKRRLQTRELSPNHRSNAGVTILHYTMMCRLEVIEKAVPILLRYGADANLLWGKTEEDSGPLTFLFDNEVFTPALAKLFLTYGADYKIYESIIPQDDCFKQFVTLSSTYYPFSQTLKRANHYFETGEYENASREYQAAVEDLEGFAQEDEEKRDDPAYGYREQYVQDYQSRAEMCRGKIQECDQQLKQQNESTALLKKYV